MEEHGTVVPFVGRAQELRALHWAVVEALGGRGRLWLLAGPAGIGKTRMADEVAAEAQRRGATVLWGRCWEGEGAPVFWPWLQILRAYARAHDGTALRADLGAGAAALAELDPEIKARFPDLPRSLELEPEQQRFRLFDSMATFLRSAAERRPLVLLLDDLHWADRPTLRLLQFVARACRDVGLLMLGTFRDPELSPSDPLLGGLGALARESERLDLRGLNEEELGRLIELVDGTMPDPGMLRSVHRRTEGNPFFTAELLRLWAADGRPSVATTLLPPSVRQALQRRLVQLSPACQEMLALAAVVGREFQLAVLRIVWADTTASGGDSGPLLALLDEALAHRIIEPLPPSLDRYHFAHALMRETLYDGLARQRRAQLHARVGAALEHVHAGDLETHVAELAHHWGGAALIAGVEKAVMYATRAGERSSRLLAYEDAAEHFQAALHAIDAAVDHPETSARLCHLLIALGEARARAGEMSVARETLVRAAGLARQLGLPEALARAALAVAGADVTTRVEPLHVALLEEALAACGPHDSMLRARLLSRLANALHLSDAQERRAELSAQAVAVAERLGDASTVASVLGAQHFALWSPSTVDQRLAIASRIITLGEASGRKDLALAGHFWRVVDALELGDMATTDESLRRYWAVARELRQPFHLWRARAMQAMRTLLEGRFAESERLIEETLEFGERAESPNAPLIYAVQLYGLRREQGRLQELEPAITALAAEHATIPAFRAGLALLYAHLGRRDEARAIFETLATTRFAQFPRDANWLNAMDELAQVCALLGDRERAAILYDLLLPHARQHVVIAFADAYEGAVTRYLGLLAGTLERWDAGARFFEAAIAAHAQVGARPLLAHTQREYAQLLLARDAASDRPHAGELLAAAATTYQALGMESFAAAARALLRDAPAAAPLPGTVERAQNRSDRSVSAASGNIFRREGDYWTVTYAGRTARLHDLKGLHYIAQLLREPRREFHVADLTHALAGGTGRRAHGGGAMHAGADVGIPDASARLAYRRRVDELRDELENAKRCNDPGRAARARDEIELLTAELSAVYGLRASRKSTEPVEKIRKAVTNCIRDALRKLRREHEPLWRHLVAGVRTGTFCSYEPEQPTPWQVDTGLSSQVLPGP